MAAQAEGGTPPAEGFHTPLHHNWQHFFINQHFVYLKSFIKKHNNFFLNINEYWFRRTDLKKNNTMYLYLYRNTQEILNSYQKAKELNYYLGWEEMINRYRRFFPEIENIKPAPSPYYILDKYYGNLSIQEYRKLLKSERLLLIVDTILSIKALDI